MCVGIPVQITSVDGIAGRATDGIRDHLVDLSLTGPVAPGTWVLSFLGAAREVLDADTAQKIRSALSALESVMAGEGVGDAFADLDARTPTLPPHLEAARVAGQSEG